MTALAEAIATQNNGHVPAGNQEPQRFIIRNAAYALQPQLPMRYIVEKLIACGSVNLFYGEPGSKKTYVLISLGVNAAMGKNWIGFNIPQPVKVLIIDEDSGERRLTLRLGAAIRGEIGDETLPIEYVSLAQFKLDNPDDVTIVKALIESSGAQLVIIDALADVMDGDENSKEFVQPVFIALRKIAEQTDAAIIIIHHSNKVGGYRGSSAMKSKVDIMVKVTSEDGSDFINFETEKTRDVTAQKWSARATWTEDQFYLTAADTREKVKPLTDSQAYVMEFLAAGPQSLPEIENSAQVCSGRTARGAVYSLAKMGKIYRTNPGETGHGAAAIYALRESL
jgi:RecA-family ATPase